MSALALRIIRDEHLAIASVLYSLRSLLRQARTDGITPDLRLLRAMLDYIVVFPERLHHPKEDRYLFRTLLARCPDAQKLVADLEGEHVRGAKLIKGLQNKLAAYGKQGAAAFEPFAKAVDAYAEFHWEHMNKEEERLLPLAERYLTAADWADVGEAFRSNDNPLSGIKPRDQAEQLYQRILSLTTEKPAEKPTE